MTNIKLSTILKGLESDGINTSELSRLNPNTREGISDMLWYREKNKPSYSTWWGPLEEYCCRRIEKFNELEA